MRLYSIGYCGTKEIALCIKSSLDFDDLCAHVQCMSTLDSQLLKITAQIRAEGHAQGRAEGYKAGYAAGIAAISKAAADQLGGARSAEPKTAVPRKPQKRRIAPKKTIRRTEKGASSEQVLRAIKDYPGRTGVEVIKLLTPMNGRTVRTALRRLREHGEIEQHDMRWYAKGAYRQAA